MDFQPKTEHGSPPIFDSNSHRNMSETMSISEIVSAMQASVDRFKEILLARDAKHKAEIRPLQEKFELERLIRLQAEEKLKRARENYEALLKKVKESGFCYGTASEESRNKNPEMKRKRVDDNDNSSNNVVAELRNRVAELEDANNKHLETIEKLSAEITKLTREKNINADSEPLGNTEGEPQAVLQSNIDVGLGHSLGASASGPVSEEEIRVVLIQKTPVTIPDIVAKFKARLRSDEDKKAFADTLIRVSKAVFGYKLRDKDTVTFRDKYRKTDSKK